MAFFFPLTTPSCHCSDYETVELGSGRHWFRFVQEKPQVALCSDFGEACILMTWKLVRTKVTSGKAFFKLRVWYDVGVHFL
jgi:hypothetical protein